MFKCGFCGGKLISVLCDDIPEEEKRDELYMELDWIDYFLCECGAQYCWEEGFVLSVFWATEEIKRMRECLDQQQPG